MTAKWDLRKKLVETPRFPDAPHTCSGLYGRCCGLCAIFRKYSGDEVFNSVAMYRPPRRPGGAETIRRSRRFSEHRVKNVDKIGESHKSQLNLNMRFIS